MLIYKKHTLIQNISSFTSLRTLYFLHIRFSSSGSNPILETELISFLTDSLKHFPSRKLRYLGVSERYATVESPAEIARRTKMIESKRSTIMKKKKAAKGKSKEEPWGDLSMLANKGLDDFKSFIEDDDWDWGGYEHMAVKVKECGVRWHNKLWEAEDCKVFKKGIRLGKLTWET